MDERSLSRGRTGSSPLDRAPPVGTPHEPSYVSVVADPLVEMHELLTRTNYWGERVDLKAILMGGVTAVFGAEIIALAELIGWANEAGAIRWIPPSLLALSLVVLLMAGVMGGRSFYPQLARFNLRRISQRLLIGAKIDKQFHYVGSDGNSRPLVASLLGKRNSLPESLQRRPRSFHNPKPLSEVAEQAPPSAPTLLQCELQGSAQVLEAILVAKRDAGRPSVA
jgi:hypothetical protein